MITASGIFALNAPEKLAWSFATSGAIYSSPAFGNGSIYIGSDDKNLYCLNSQTGELRWSYATEGIIRCRPAVLKGIVYFASDDGNLYALNSKTGKNIWKCYIGRKPNRILPGVTPAKGEYWDYMQSSPVLNAGTVYIGSGDSCLYAVNAQSGKIKWKAKTDGIIRSTPCVDKEIVFVGSFDGFIYAFDENSGKMIWKVNLAGKQYRHVQCSPVVKKGILYCGGRNPFFYALDSKTGNEIWKFSYDFSWVESSAIVNDGVVYVGSSDLNMIYAFDAKNGAVKWSSKIENTSWSTPFYDDGVIYIGLASYKATANELAGGGILAVDASTGKTKWKIECGQTPFIGGIVSSPLVEKNTLYYGSLDGNIYAVKIVK
jgi:outer membrane protein assembly factor BamB